MPSLPLLAYDMAFPSPDGHYFPWAHPDVSRAAAKDIWSEISKLGAPAKCNDWQPDDLHGGIFTFASDHAVAYRFFNAGRDGGFRPHRFVMLAAVFTRAELRQKNWLALLQSGLFAVWAQKPVPLPCPEPAIKEIVWPPSSVFPMGEAWKDLLRQDRWDLPQTMQTMSTVTTLLASLPNSCEFIHVRVDGRGSLIGAKVQARWKPMRVEPRILEKSRASEESGVDFSPNSKTVLNPSPPPAPADCPQRGNIMLRYPAIWAFLCFLLGVAPGFWLGRTLERNQPPPLVSDAPGALPDVEFLQHFLDHAEKLAAHLPAQSPKLFQKKLEKIRSDLSRPSVTTAQLGRCRKEIDDLFGELALGGPKHPAESSNLESNRMRNLK